MTTAEPVRESASQVLAAAAASAQLPDSIRRHPAAVDTPLLVMRPHPEIAGVTLAEPMTAGEALDVLTAAGYRLVRLPQVLARPVYIPERVPARAFQAGLVSGIWRADGLHLVRGLGSSFSDLLDVRRFAAELLAMADAIEQATSPAEPTEVDR